jgi:hypothetical protein
MSNPTNITYGSYSFRDQAGPIPHPRITVTYLVADDGTQLGTRYNMTLENVLTPLPSGAGGYTSLDGMQDALISGFSIQGQNLLITCAGNTLLSAYPRINDITLDRSSDNWVYTTPYTIQMEWDGPSYTGNIWVEGITETWSLEFNEDAAYYDWLLPGNTGDKNSVLVNLNHTVAAKGIAHYTATGLLAPYQSAKSFVASRLGYNGSEVAQVGVINLAASNFSPYNHMRVVEEDKAGGSYSCTENWILTTGYRAIEDFTASMQYSQEEGLTSVDIQGSIQGLETRNYGAASGTFNITETKWAAASGYWDIVRPKLLGRAKFVSSLDINPLPLTWSVGHSPTKGVISYGYVYDNRACNFIEGAVYEKIRVSDSYPTDVFAVVPIPGRAYGPILQDINTVTESRRNISVEVLMGPPTGCNSYSEILTNRPKAQVEEFMCAMQSEISGENVQLFKSADTDDWDVKTGRYSRQVEFTYVPCGGTPPSTDFCS